MLPLDEKEVAALGRLAGTEWETILGWFERNLKSVQEQMVHAREDVLLRQLQGQAQVLSRVLSADAEAKQRPQKTRIGGSPPTERF